MMHTNNRPPAWLIAGVFLYGASGVSAVRTAQDTTNTAKTPLDGVYSKAQAQRGEALYSQYCAKCHAPDLAGADVAPALAGADFNSNWNGLSLGDLFERIQIGMPADKPGSVSLQDNTDILAFMLSRGEFPAGEADLPAQVEVLKTMKFAAKRP